MKWSKFTLEYIDYFKNNRTIISDNNKLLKYIKEERHKISQFIKSNKNISFKISQVPNYRVEDKFIQYIDSNWVDSKNVINQINHNLNKTFVVEWDNIRIIVRTNIKPKFFNRIKYIIYLINYLKFKTNNNTKLDIYIVLTDLIKQFPNNNEMIGIETANSGYTWFHENIICIWRYEEIEKVLFHELVHFYDLDYKDL